MSVALTSSPAPTSTRQEPLRVMVVDDSVVIRGMISRWIGTEPDMVVAASLRSLNTNETVSLVLALTGKTGVAFTADPVSGRSDRLIIEGSFGLGEAIVSGKVTPDRMVLARDGLRVRVIYDWMGGLGKTSRKFWRALRDAGVEVRCFNPLRFSNPFGWVHRDHRKMLIADGRLDAFKLGRRRLVRVDSIRRLVAASER